MNRLVRWLITNLENQKFDGSVLRLSSIHRSKCLCQGLLITALLSVLTIGIGISAGALEFSGHGSGLFALIQVFGILTASILLALASRFGEEIAFRRHLQIRIAQRYNSPLAVMFGPPGRDPVWNHSCS